MIQSFDVLRLEPYLNLLKWAHRALNTASTLAQGLGIFTEAISSGLAVGSGKLKHPQVAYAVYGRADCSDPAAETWTFSDLAIKRNKSLVTRPVFTVGSIEDVDVANSTQSILD